MILNSQDKQFSLSEGGQVHWQADPTNPLTGPVIGAVEKGEGILSPVVALYDTEFIKDLDREAVQTFVQGWLDRHLRTVLAPLFVLKDEEGIDGPAKEIAAKVYDALGILQREHVQGLINTLDEDGRAALRKRRLRMGPLLIYLPELNKPAAVRLQALVWNLWHGLDLPAIVPADGMVSFSVRDQDIDPDYYRGIGYPVYGPRAIRVDMLDRVVCAVYDGAKDGKFQAQHQMAEWLGSNILDLYDILEAMGHRKVHDPQAVQGKEEERSVRSDAGHDTAAAPVEQPLEKDKAAVSHSSGQEPAADAGESGEGGESEEKKADDKNQDRPALAIFALKRGRASEKVLSRTKPKTQNRGPASAGSKSDKPFRKAKKQKQGDKKPRERVIQAGPKPKPEDSPFAVLQQLKLGHDKET